MLSFDKRNGVQLLVRIYNHFSYGCYSWRMRLIIPSKNYN